MSPPEPQPLLSAVARLAASRERLRLALHPAPPADWVARAQAICQPSLQRHPVVWVLGGLVVGGLGAVLWRHLPDAWMAKLKHTLATTLGAVGQEALLSWWLNTLQGEQQPRGPEAAGPPPATKAPPGPTPSSAGG